MENKKFVVENPKTHQRFTIEGKSLKDALKQEGLDPEKWLQVKESAPSEE